MRHPIVILLLAGFGLPGFAADLPVRGITLSSAGVAQVERAGPVEGGGVATFRLPLNDVDDLLRSLSVADPAGAVVGVRLPAQDLEAEAFRGLPLRPEDFSSRVTLLSALRGQAVTAGGAEGRIADAAEAAEGALRLTLVTPEGLRSVVLRDGDQVRFSDAALGARIARAAEAVAAARSADERRITIALTGPTTREVAVAYVAGAPVWKPSYRLFVPGLGAVAEARIQAWAVVENATGSDWEDVRLTLVSGEAAAFRQALFTPIRLERVEMPVRVADAVLVQADTGARPAPPPPPVMAMPAPAPMAAMARSVAAASEASAPAAPAIAAASAGRVAFRLPQPVDLRAGETANLPFLDARLPAERVWWVQDFSARNPLSAARITNTSGSTLPDALASVFGTTGAEAGGYLGDAELRALPAGEQRLLAFARDRDVLITRGGGTSTDRTMRVERRRGGLLVVRLQRQEVSLAIDPKGTAGTMLVDVARQSGMTPRFTVAAEGDFGLRHEVSLAGGPVTLTLPFEREVTNEIVLWDPGLGDPGRIVWRQFDVEQNLRRLPGGPGNLENLRDLLARMAPEAPGRTILAETVDRLAEARAALDAFRLRLRELVTAEAALARARTAVEDRSGPEREAARRRLNEASVAVERAGTATDTAWDAWIDRVQAILGG